MGGQELAHGEGTHALVAEDLGHLLVGDEELLVLGILKPKEKTMSQHFLNRYPEHHFITNRFCISSRNLLCYSF
jgi:hypothetical protein